MQYCFLLAEEAQAKARAIVETHEKFVAKKRKPKMKQLDVAGKLPKLSKTNNEEDIAEYMTVLRKTHEEIGKTLRSKRMRNKAIDKERARAAKNPKDFINQHVAKKIEGKQSVKNKIKQMRQDRTFPQPKSSTNFKKRKGLLGKNTIETVENKK